jgi:hypothetical protein
MYKLAVLMDDMKREAATSQDKTRSIIRDAVRSKDDGVLAALPSRGTTSRRIQRVRRRLNRSPPLPTAHYGFTVPVTYTTSERRRFLMYDSGVDNHSRILVYSNDENLDAIVSKTDWFMDRNFYPSATSKPGDGPRARHF